jgi:L-cystine uptake protein TcyP (sodium:dicarboxylate symporter family)
MANQITAILITLILFVLAVFKLYLAYSCKVHLRRALWVVQGLGAVYGAFIYFVYGIGSVYIPLEYLMHVRASIIVIAGGALGDAIMDYFELYHTGLDCLKELEEKGE